MNLAIILLFFFLSQSKPLSLVQNKQINKQKKNLLFPYERTKIRGQKNSFSLECNIHIHISFFVLYNLLLVIKFENYKKTPSKNNNNT